MGCTVKREAVTGDSAGILWHMLACSSGGHNDTRHLAVGGEDLAVLPRGRAARDEAHAPAGHAVRKLLLDDLRRAQHASQDPEQYPRPSNLKPMRRVDTLSASWPASTLHRMYPQPGGEPIQQPLSYNALCDASSMKALSPKVLSLIEDG